METIQIFVHFYWQYTECRNLHIAIYRENNTPAPMYVFFIKFWFGFDLVSKCKYFFSCRKICMSFRFIAFGGKDYLALFIANLYNITF